MRKQTLDIPRPPERVQAQASERIYQHNRHRVRVIRKVKEVRR
jgi:hypothetical protein